MLRLSHEESIKCDYEVIMPKDYHAPTYRSGLEINGHVMGVFVLEQQHLPRFLVPRSLTSLNLTDGVVDYHGRHV